MTIILELAKMAMKAIVYNFVIREHLKRSMFWGKCFGQRAQVIPRARSPFYNVSLLTFLCYASNS